MTRQGWHSAGVSRFTLSRRSLVTWTLASSAEAARSQGEELLLRTCSQAELPLKFDLANSQRPGICVEIIGALQQIDPGLHFFGLERELPLKRVAQELAGHQLDLFFSMIDTPDRIALGVDFLDEPVLYESRHQVAVRADDDIQLDKLPDITALRGRGVVLVTHGTAYVEHLQRVGGIQLSKLALSNSQNLKMLLVGRGRFFYHAGSTLRSQIAIDGLQDRVRILPTVFKVEAQRLAFSPRLATATRKRVVAALRQLDRNGGLQRLRDRYGVD
jgi:glutamate/aspartate transport system substrate-binding protein